MEQKNTKKIDTNSNNLHFAVLATDVVIWTIYNQQLYLRLIHVNLPPYFKDLHGLPGGLIKPKETALEAAQRLILDKASLNPKQIYLEQLYTFSGIARDPRGRVVSVAYNGVVPWSSLSSTEQQSNAVSQWCQISDLPKLAYDHQEIINMALERLQSKITYTNIISKLISKEFTLTELEKHYEIILQKKIDKRNFRKKILSLNILTPLQKFTSGLKSRPAQLYKFKSSEIKNINMI